MKSQLHWNDRQSSKGVTPQHFQKPQLDLILRLNEFWQSVLTFFSPSTEPRVWQTKDTGKADWNAYDPLTGKSIEQVSTQELRVWLEERYYQGL